MDILNYFGKLPQQNDVSKMTMADRHQPRVIGDFMGNYKQVQEINEWFENKNNEYRQKGLLIVGPTGCGKTVLSTLMCEKHGRNMFSRNASHKRTRKELYAYYESVRRFTHNGVFVLDDMETLVNKNDNVSMTEIAKWADTTTDDTIRMVYITNSVYINKMSAIASACKTVHLEYPPTKTLFSKCLDIAEKESIGLSDTEMRQLKQLIESQRDPRMVINSINIVSLVYNVKKDIHMDIYDTYRMMLDSGAPLDTKLRHFATDAGTIPIILQENYIDFATSVSTETLASVSDSMSLADVYHKKMFALPTSLSGVCTDTYAMMSCVFPEYYNNADIKESKVYRYPRFGLIWTKQSAMYQKRKYWGRFEEHYAQPITSNESCIGSLNDMFKHLIKEYMKHNGKGSTFSTESAESKNRLVSFLSFYNLNEPSNAELAFDLYNSYNVTPTTDKPLTKKAFMIMFAQCLK